MGSSRRLVLFINIGHALDHMFMLIFATAALVMAAGLGLTYGELLQLSAGGFLAFGAGSIPAGWLGDRWSRRGMLGVFFFGLGTSAILTGLAQGPGMVAAGLTLIGAFASIYHPVGTAMLVAASDRMGRDIGINGVWGNMGIAGAALLTGALCQWFGWRWAFILPGSVAILFGVAFVMIVPDDPAKKAAAKKPVEIPREVMLRVFAVLAIVSITGGVVFNAMSVAVPKLLTERVAGLGDYPAWAGLLAAGIFAAGAMSQLIVGHLVDRHPLKLVFVPLAALQAPFLLLASGANNGWLVFAAFAVVFAMFGQVTINDTMLAKYTADAWRARAFAVRYFVSFGVSAMAAPLVGTLHDGMGFATTLIVLAGFGAMVFLGALLFPLRRQEIAATA